MLVEIKVYVASNVRFSFIYSNHKELRNYKPYWVILLLHVVSERSLFYATFSSFQSGWELQ